MDIWSEIKQTFKQGSIITRLIYVNLAVFLSLKIMMVFFYLFKIDIPIIEWLALSADLDVFITRPWTLITYMFLHSGFLHILFNLLWLYWFGKIFLMYFDEKKLLGTYLVGGFAGGAVYVLAYNLFPAFDEIFKSSILMGASASIIAIVTAAAIYAPNLSINLLLISSIFGPIKIIWIAAITIVLSIIGISGTNAGGNLAHLGGALWGYLYMIQLKKGRDLTSKFNKAVYSFKSPFQSRKKMRITYRSSKTQQMTDWEYNKKRRIEKENINVILDKISKSGYDSLSTKEKEILFKMGNKKGKPN